MLSPLLRKPGNDRIVGTFGILRVSRQGSDCKNEHHHAE
jgi:hypothetical protein